MTAKFPEYTRVVAERDGEIVGTATINSHHGGLYEPHRYWVGSATHEQHRHTGVDNAMIEALLEHVQAVQPEQLWTYIREDFVPMVEFLDAFNFNEEFRSWGSHLDVQAFDMDAYLPQKQELEAEGIRFCSYLELDEANRERDLVSFHKQIEEDVPFYEPIIPKERDDIREDNIPDESCFVALDGNTIVGMASLDTCVEGLLQNGLTGVHRDYRNRGIATVLKALVASYAKTQGEVDINAAGSGENQAMRHVNEKLGYMIEPAWITFKAVL
ncbi:MAG: GNAT family N-acetyltransferase [Deinococcota bacterium]